MARPKKEKAASTEPKERKPRGPSPVEKITVDVKQILPNGIEIQAKREVYRLVGRDEIYPTRATAYAAVASHRATKAEIVKGEKFIDSAFRDIDKAEALLTKAIEKLGPERSIVTHRGHSTSLPAITEELRKVLAVFEGSAKKEKPQP